MQGLDGEQYPSSRPEQYLSVLALEEHFIFCLDGNPLFEAGVTFETDSEKVCTMDCFPP